MMPRSNLLILGGGGFVGRRLVKILSQEGYEKINVLSRHIETFPFLPGVYYHSGSLDERGLLQRLLPECEVVIHLACATTPSASALRPVFEIESNLLPTLRFLEMLHNYPQVRLIYLSTGGALYGNQDCTVSLVKENTFTTPLSYYGANKAATEQFIIAFCEQQPRPAIILRPANFYGPEQPLKPGFGIVPTIFHRLLQNEPIQIWGEGENVRDYLYIDDFIALCVMLLKTPQLQMGVKIYHAGSEQGTSLNQLCALIEKVTGIPLKREYHPSRAIDVKRIVLDCSHLRHDYRWQAQTDLFTGLQLTWEWFKKNREI